MSRYVIVPCRLRHLRELASTMRAEDRAEIELAGFVPRHLLHALWRGTLGPLTALVDDEVAAVWGDAAGLLDEVGSMWIFTAPPIERVPLAFFREARRDIAERLRVRLALRAHVCCSYERAVRFFSMLGFSLGAPEIIGSGLYRELRIERP